MSAAGPAIAVRGAAKVYRRYARRAHGTLKSALLGGGRGRAGDGGVVALDDVSFTVASGETFGVIGSNGSGKSTLLKLLAGIVRPTRGSVDVRGRLAALLELGAGFHPEISGRENIEITGLLLGLTKREIASRFDAVVEFAGVEEFLDAPIKTYSSGMAVRLGFAIAAHSDPDVLLVDEVLAVGDEAFAHRALEKFSEFERAGKTLVVVSHDLALVAERCRRVIWLEHGRLAADGPSAEVVARYRESVAAGEGERRVQGAGAGGRVGSGVATIELVRLLDREGRPVGRLRSGEAATVEIVARAPEALADFVFGVEIGTVAGAVVFGTNTAVEGYRSDRFVGDARVTLEIPALDLAPGIYTVAAAVHARDGAPYDYRRDVLRFEVSAGRPGGGVWSPERRWNFSGGIRWK
ncbi:MAG TPA: ABC transporter ATP-binding protein [Thermoanaerobaculia bacterium]|nr:ABC transporter ATP-binding protein [Thermoanaerobaculia bacterium]